MPTEDGRPVILVVDDQEVVLMVMAALIAGVFPEATVLSASSGREGLRILETREVDLALVDVQMPGMTGVEMCRQLKQDSRLAATKVLLMTAHDSTADLRAEGLLEGADDFITKPINSREFQAKLLVALRDKRERDQLLAARGWLEGQVTRVEQELQSQEAMFRELADSIEVVFWLFSLDQSVCFYVSPAYERLWESPVDTLYRSPLSWLEKVEESDRPWVEEALVGLGQEPVRLEYRLRRADGSLIWVLHTLSPVRDREGRVYRVAGTALNNTERQLGILALEESTRRHKALANSASDAIVTTDARGLIATWNPGAERMLGFGEEEALGQPLTLFIPERDRAAHLAAFALAAQGAASPGLATIREVVALRKDGREIPVELALSRWQISGVYHFAAIIRDISQRRSQEMALRQAQKMEALGTLTGGIAHDFNNILGIIMGNAELARMDAPADANLHQSLDSLMYGVIKARDLVRHLLLFSRRSDGVLAEGSLAPLVKESMKFMRATLPASIEVRTVIDDPEAVARINPTQIHQVIMNLCTNAVQALGEQGGVLAVSLATVSAGEGELLPAGLAVGVYHRLRVQDSGPGIPREIQHQIFDPFFSTKKPGEGTGLGLAVVHGIVTGHQGVIQLHSVPGEGACFDIYLPAVTVSGGVSREVEADEVLPRLEGTVLLVDDDLAVLEVEAAILGRLGLTVVACDRPRVAWERFLERPEGFDLVVTDQTMPGMSGLELGSRIQAQVPGLPMLLVTGYDHTNTTVRAVQAGFRGCLRKPVSLRELARFLGEWCPRRGDS